MHEAEVCYISMTIDSIKAREILDSRGTPTLEVELHIGAHRGVASVPSGASVGVHEALELRDGDLAIHQGRGVSKAIAHVNETIARAVIGQIFDQNGLDGLLNELDGTPNKSRLGANAILGVSIAFARARALEEGTPLYAYLNSMAGERKARMPEPLFNVLNGGKHARHGIDIQECMLAPIGLGSISEKVDAVSACMTALHTLLEEKGYETSMGDEGGFAPSLYSNEEALELLASAIARAGFSTDDIKLALDIAASSFFVEGRYIMKTGGIEHDLSKKELLTWYRYLSETYPLISIEDGFAEDDWEGFSSMTDALGGAISIVGDDLTVTNVVRINQAIERKAANACIIKPNQIGSISEAVTAVQLSRTAGWKSFASHRSGETMDAFISDFAVGLSCEYLKAGAPTKEERKIKYTRLMEIESNLMAS